MRMEELKIRSHEPNDAIKLTRIKNLCPLNLLGSGWAEQELYLCYWCDCDDKVHRWMYLRINESTLNDLEANKKQLHEIIPNMCLDPYVFILDCGEKVERIVTVLKEDLPESYKPERIEE